MFDSTLSKNTYLKKKFIRAFLKKEKTLFLLGFTSPLKGRRSHGLIVNLVDYDIVVSEFEL